MKEYEVQFNRVKSILKTLQGYSKSAESRLKPFQLLTNECISFYKRYQRKYLSRYLKRWFLTYLGVKDECMILLNGEIIREYHIPQHEEYVHQRGKESTYYNKKVTLSSCSKDGIDYEYRKLVTKFGNKMVSL
jgi:hypothetical protein